MLVNHRSDGVERLAFGLHGHHVTRDVQTDVSGGSMTGEGEASSRQSFGHIALAIVAMTDVFAATKAGNVLEDGAMGCSIAVRLLDLQAARPGKGWQLPLWYGLQQVAMWGSPLRWVSQDRPCIHESTPSQDHSTSHKRIPQQLAAIQTLT